MKHFKLIVSILLLLLLAVPLKAQGVALDCGAVSSCSLPVPAVAIGDLTVLIVRAGGPPTSISVAGFTAIGSIDSPGDHRLAVYSQIATVAGAFSVSVSAPGASTLRLTAESFAGPWDTSHAARFVSAASKGTQAASGACGTADLCVGAVTTGSNASPTVVAGETLTASAGGKVFMLTGATAASVGLASTDIWAAGVTSFNRPVVVVPKFDTLTFSVKLLGCTLCDPFGPQLTDFVPLASASIYQGASFTLMQDGQLICKGTLDVTAQASCQGAINVTPAVVNITSTVNTPSGGQPNSGWTASIPSFIAAGAVNGQVKLVLPFDAVTMLPRGAFIHTE